MIYQIISNGLLLGGLFAIVAMGFSIVWGVMNLVNLAHGAFIMLGAYITFWLFELWGIDPFLSIPISMALLFCVAYLIQRHVINLVVRAQVLMILILTFGLEILIMNLSTVAWTGNYRSVTTSYSGANIEIGPLIIPSVRLAIFFISLIITAGLYFFISKTKTGNAIKATSLDKEAAKLVGVDIGKTYAITFAIGGALAGAAGSLLAIISAISPYMGGPYTLKAFVICVLGGLGSIIGLIIGGIVLGLAESVGTIVLGPGYADAISFVILVIILVIRPEGILGKKFFAEVKH
jgi:branched-chain amino acid transport system permease protein